MDDLATLAQRTADRLATRHVGVVVAAVGGGAAEVRGAGAAGGPGGGPGPDTVFEIGSVTKVFTGLALARLAVAGAVELDEPLVRLLPAEAWVPSRGGREITLQHLATHTSGLPRLPKGLLPAALLRPNAPDPYAGCTAERLLRGLAATRLRAVPGQRFRYSNLGAGLLGLALARRAGTDFAGLVEREVSAPLGLTATGLAEVPERAARGHAPNRRPVPAWHLADLAGAGGLRSTATDLVSFLRAQLGEGGEEMAKAVTLTHAVEHRMHPFASVHLGWMSHRLHPGQGGYLQVWHNGRTGGFASFLGLDPERGVAVAVLSNTRRPVDNEGFALLRELQRGIG
ncbi:serine hydrolase domain-containing protein [Kitasatospora camelliae]|uniref:Serine hydrolase domain-containing protein n=1 Tax=Kitasatospora camelliae TaxID=3156397 RepID=A0AAU8JZB2_9ACTN